MRDAEHRPTPRDALARGDHWSWDCARCRCSGKLDLQKLVDEGRGSVGPDTMRCPNCKAPELSIRVTPAKP